MGRFQKRLDLTGVSAKNAAKWIAGLFGAFGAAIAIRGATRLIAQFEQTIAVLGNVSGATAQQLRVLEDQARSLGATTRFAAREAAEAQLFLARAGFTANEILAATPATLALAQAGMLDLGQAADFASNIMTQFGLAAEEMTRIVDTLVNTANSANTNVLQLAEAMKFAGPIAGTMGVQVEEAAAAIGTLGNSGIQASLAGTNLRAIMIRLVNPTAGAQAAIKDLGLELEDLDPTVNSLVDIFERLQTAQLSAQQAAEIFGTRVAGGALILTRNVDAMRQLNESNRDAAGTAAEAARVMDDTLIGAFKGLVSIVQEVGLKIGEGGLLSTLTRLARVMTNTIRLLAGVEDEASRADIAAKALADGIKILAIFLAGLVAIKTIMFLSNLALTLGTVTQAVHQLNLALLANPFLALAAGLAAVVTISFGFRSAMKDNVDAVRETSMEVLDLTAKIAALEAVQVKFQRATETESTGGQISATRERIQLLEGIVETLRGRLADRERSARQDRPRATRDEVLASLREGLPGNAILIEDLVDLSPSPEWKRMVRDLAAQTRKEVIKEDPFLTKNPLTGPNVGAQVAYLNELRSQRAAADAAKPGVGDILAEVASLGFAETKVDRPVPRVDVQAPRSDLIAVELDKVIPLLEKYIKSEEEREEVLRKLREEQQRAAEAERRRTQVIDASINASLAEREALGKSGEELAALNARRKAEEAAKELGLELTQQEIDAIEKEARATARLRKQIDDEKKAREENAREQEKSRLAREAGLRTSEALLRQLEQENALLSASKEDRARLAVLQRIENIERETGIDITEEQTARMVELAEANEKLREAQNKRLTDEEKALKKAVEDRKAALEAAQGMIETLKIESRLIGLTNDERERAESLYAFQIEANKALGAGTKEAAQATEEYLFLLERLDKMRDITEMSRAMAREISQAFGDFLLGATTVEEALERIAVSIAELTLEKLVLSPLTDMISSGISSLLGAGSSSALAQQIQSAQTTVNTAAMTATVAASTSTVAAENSTVAAENSTVAAQNATIAASNQTIAASNTTIAAANITLGVANITTALSNTNTALMTVNTPVVMIQSGFTLAAEHGMAVASHGRPVGFAQGGARMVTQPEFFPLSGGRTGVRGEAGPEITAPAVRLPNGDLGLQVQDRSGPKQQVIENNSYVFNISGVRDTDDFRRSEPQIGRRIQRVARNRRRAVGTE
jgi:TP901 family phage tail tape measure protein